MGNTVEIDVTPKWWKALYAQHIGPARWAMFLHMATHASAIRMEGGRLGDALGKVRSMGHTEDALTMRFDERHGLNLDALRGAVLDRLNSPDVEAAATAAIPAYLRQFATIKISRVGP